MPQNALRKPAHNLGSRRIASSKKANRFAIIFEIAPVKIIMALKDNASCASVFFVAGFVADTFLGAKQRHLQ